MKRAGNSLSEIPAAFANSLPSRTKRNGRARPRAVPPRPRRRRWWKQRGGRSRAACVFSRHWTLTGVPAVFAIAAADHEVVEEAPPEATAMRSGMVMSASGCPAFRIRAYGPAAGSVGARSRLAVLVVCRAVLGLEGRVGDEGVGVRRFHDLGSALQGRLDVPVVPEALAPGLALQLRRALGETRARLARRLALVPRHAQLLAGRLGGPEGVRQDRDARHQALEVRCSLHDERLLTPGSPPRRLSRSRPCPRSAALS